MKHKCFSLQYFSPVNDYNQHSPEADVSHSIAVSSDLFEPSYWHFLKQSSKALMTKHLRFSDNFEKEAYKTNIYLSALYYVFHFNIV